MAGLNKVLARSAARNNAAYTVTPPPSGGGGISEQEPILTGVPRTAEQAQSQLQRTSSQASNALARYAFTPGTQQRLEQIAARGFEDQTPDTSLLGSIGSGFEKLLGVLDMPRRMVALGLKDALGFDESGSFGAFNWSGESEEITWSDYWNAFTGDREALRESLGENIAGQYGDVSTSSALSQIGWEPTDSWSITGGLWNKLARFGVSLVGDVATDPLSVLGAGMTMGRRFALNSADDVLRAATKGAATAAKAAGPTKHVDDLVKAMKPMQASIAGDIKRLADDAFVKLQAITDPTLLGDAQTTQALWEEAVDAVSGLRMDPEALEGFRDLLGEGVENALERHANTVGKELGARRMDNLPDWWVDDPTVPSNLKGGLRVSTYENGLPRLAISPTAIQTSKIIPGTIGKGTVLRDKTVFKARDFLDGIFPGFKKTREGFYKLVPHLDANAQLYRTARDGRFYTTMVLAKDQEVAIGKHLAVWAKFQQAWESVADQASKDGIEDAGQRELGRKILDIVNGGALDAAWHAQPWSTELKNRAMTFASVMRESLDSLQADAREVFEKFEYIEDFVPFKFSPEFNELVQSQDGLLPKIPQDAAERKAWAAKFGVSEEDVAHYIAAVDYLRDRIHRIESVGETIHARRRSLGATVESLDEPFFQSKELHGTRYAYTAQGDMEEGILRVLKAWKEKGGAQAEQLNLETRLPVTKPKGRVKRHLPGGGTFPTELRVFEDDPIKVMASYLYDVTNKTLERKLVNSFEKVGLLTPAKRVESIDLVMQSIQPQFAASEDAVRRVVNERAMIKQGKIAKVRQVVTKKVKVGLVDRTDTMISFEVPKHVARDPRFKTVLKRAKDQIKTANRHTADVARERTRLIREITSSGIDENLATALVDATAGTIAQVRSEVRAIGLDLAHEIENDLIRTVLLSDEGFRMMAIENLDEILSEATALRRQTQEAIDELGDQMWAAMPKDEEFYKLSAGLEDNFDPAKTQERVRQFVDRMHATLNTQREAEARLAQQSFEDLDSQVARLHRMGHPIPKTLAHRHKMAELHLTAINSAHAGSARDAIGILMRMDREANQFVAKDLIDEFSKYIDAIVEYTEKSGSKRAADWAGKVTRVRELIEDARNDPNLFHTMQVWQWNGDREIPTVIDGMFDDPELLELVAQGMKLSEGMSISNAREIVNSTVVLARDSVDRAVRRTEQQVRHRMGFEGALDLDEIELREIASAKAKRLEWSANLKKIRRGEPFEQRVLNAPRRAELSALDALYAGNFEWASQNIDRLNELTQEVLGRKMYWTIQQDGKGRWHVWLSRDLSQGRDWVEMDQLVRRFREGTLTPDDLLGRTYAQIEQYAELDTELRRRARREQAIKRRILDTQGETRPWLSGDYAAAIEHAKNLDPLETRVATRNSDGLDIETRQIEAKPGFANRGKSVADAYEDALEDYAENGISPEALRAYTDLRDEVAQQYAYMVERDGITIELYPPKRNAQLSLLEELPYEPYPNSAAMVADVRRNKRLKVLRTDLSKMPEDHPLRAGSGVYANGEELTYNELFRAVHDYFGHAQLGNQFGPLGEETAWLLHARMFSPNARRAMTAETRGQNSWVNFGPHMRDADGNLLKRPVDKKPQKPLGKRAQARRDVQLKVPEEYEDAAVVPRWLPPAERPFAPQAPVLLPDSVVFDSRYSDLDGWLRGSSREPLPAGASEKAWAEIGPLFQAAVEGRKTTSVLRLKEAITTKNGQPTKAWNDLLNGLSPDMATRLSRTVEHLIAADPKATPIIARLGEPSKGGWRSGTNWFLHKQWEDENILMRPLMRHIERLNTLQQTIDMEHAMRQAATEYGVQQEQDEVIALAEEFLQRVSALKRWAVEYDERGLPVGGARFSDFHDAFREDIKAAQEASEALYKRSQAVSGIKGAPGKYKKGERNAFRTATRGTVGSPERDLSLRITAPGKVQTRSIGLGGALSEADIDPIFSLMFENLVDNQRVLYTPYGMERLGIAVRDAHAWWKAAATIRRPSFHVRNFISIVYNNMIGGVGAENYKNAVHVIKFDTLRHKMRGVPDELWEALEKGSKEYGTKATPKEIVDRIREAWERGVFDTAFSSTFDESIYNPARTKLLNIFSVDHITTRFGARTMEALEGWGRFAAFDAWYNGVDNGRTAAAVAEALHFNYKRLGSAEEKIKKIAPFFVWTRRNVPLQIETLFTQPRIAARYAHFISEVRENFGAGDEEGVYPHSSFFTPFAVQTDWMLNRSTPWWARIVFDPEVPLNDLSDLPGLNGQSAMNPLEWGKYMAGLLGPAFTTPLNLWQTEDWGDRNAPVGLNLALQMVNEVPGFGQMVDVSSQGDAQIPYAVRAGLETVVPFWSEYTAAFENDPARANKLGLTPEMSNLDPARLRAALLRTVGRGLGLQAQVPSDTASATFNASDFVRDVTEKQRKGIN